jgi:hypothetical protein
LGDLVHIHHPASTGHIGTLMRPPTHADQLPPRPAVAATAPPELIVRWDPDGGWAHLARHIPDSTPEFAGLLYFGTDGAEAVRARLCAMGFAVSAGPSHGGLLELRLVAGSAPASTVTWPEPEVRH